VLAIFQAEYQLRATPPANPRPYRKITVLGCAKHFEKDESSATLRHMCSGNTFPSQEET